MAVWTVYLSLCLLVALNASVETLPVGGKPCSACASGWSAYGCRCFKFFNKYKTWSVAENLCLSYGGNLASIHSHDEYIFIQNLIRRETHATTRTWIGGRYAEGHWLWSDGTEMTYQIWSPGEPNDHIYELCVEMNSFHGNWNDVKCHYNRPYVCVK
ncbi:galactose-specific lectin nattectin-like [Megalobrama amblycephala]|uniref:galactose-specific lectin nattectin-like n=1 Tax=Megalobrama amblycephala TaxID=75352 RepID=UPI002013CB29|nr:galactose-specific lectin nattectin-like [Megalobrama amblycephala]